MFRWLAGRGAHQKQVDLAQADIRPEDWRALLANLPFLAGLSADETDALRRKTAWLLASKTYTGAHDLPIDEHIRLSVAVQAALPILALSTRLYEGWTEIILYPGTFLIPRQDVEDSGVVHEYVQEAWGEAWEGGPVILSWEAAQPGQPLPANVVIHEFAHKLDVAGEQTGLLFESPRHAAHCLAVRDQAYDAFVTALDAVEDAIPHDVDPESEAANAWYDTLPLDPYAATDEAEFFAVSSEAFFVQPAPLAQALPDWYDVLRSVYRQDPLARLGDMPSAWAR